MTYDLHPLFVHFPIALLFLYSISKIIPVKKWFPSIAWKDIQRVLLVIGVLGAFGALFTGENAQRLSNPNHQLVEAHSTFAAISTWLYVALLVFEFLSIYKPTVVAYRGAEVVSSIVAFIALICIILTGLLGGVMVYGTSADPLAGIVLKLLGISL